MTAGYASALFPDATGRRAAAGSEIEAVYGD
jgi:hypothetical protein